MVKKPQTPPQTFRTTSDLMSRVDAWGDENGVKGRGPAINALLLLALDSGNAPAKAKGPKKAPETKPRTVSTPHGATLKAAPSRSRWS